MRRIVCGRVREGTVLGEIDALRDDLAASRAELLAAVEGITPEEFERRPPGEPTEADERWPVRDVLWHVGLIDDWFRRMISQAMAGKPLDRYRRFGRPPQVDTPERLVMWLEQARRPLLSLLGRLPEERLDEEFTLPEGEVRTVRRLLTYLVRHDRVHAEQVRGLREGARPSTGSG
jgi:uncharacterized damage-inducible protein DinB